MTENNAEQINNPDALLKAYRQAVEDLKDERAKNKTLQADLDKKVPDESEWKNRAIKAETKAAVASATGIKDVDRLMNYVGTDGIDFDDEGNLTGVNERLEQVKKDLPELFDVKRRVGGKGDIFGGEPANIEPVDPMREAVHNALNPKN